MKRIINTILLLGKRFIYKASLLIAPHAMHQPSSCSADMMAGTDGPATPHSTMDWVTRHNGKSHYRRATESCRQE